ncbi:RimK family alpha-L-glutamate ligase [Streptomyces sp. NPDC049040]|uniref:ATP-grasp domain-containing protein n=1 Tax=Streptomyces sp. NPDC049040 TaxID=3365593 RepID=UPI0037103C05
MADGPTDFLSQLTSPDHTLDVRPRTEPAIVLLSRACDADLDAVEGLLAGVGIRTARLNADELADTCLTVDPHRRAARLHGRWLTPTVTWIRHFAPAAIEGPGDPARIAFLRESWQAAAASLAGVSRTSLLASAPGPLAQLEFARGHGVAVPRTMVTTDPYRAFAEFGCRRLVVKAAHRHFVESEPGRLRGVFPVVVEQHTLSTGVGPPVIVQEYVEHETELRVYYVAGQLHAFRIDKGSAAALWLAPDTVGVSAVTPPPSVAAAATRLAAAMSLRYGAFDFLLRAGTPVFLEVNPDGDWRWAERKSHTTPVTAAVAAMLAALHRDAPDRQGCVQ